MENKEVSKFEVKNGIYNIKDTKGRNMTKELENKIENLYVKELGGQLAYRTYNQYIPNITTDTSSSPVWSYVQGLTLTNHNTIILSFSPKKSQEKSNKVLLREVDLSTRRIIREKVLKLYHSNSLAFNEKEQVIYSACSSGWNGQTQVANNHILVIDYSTLNIIRDITPPREILDYNRVRSVSYDNKSDVLVYGDTSTIYIMSNEMTVEKKVQLNIDSLPSPTNSVVQTIKYYDSKIYLMQTNPCILSVFNLDGDILTSYNLYNINCINLGESEDFDIQENDIYFSSVQKVVSISCTVWDITVFKSNLVKGMANNTYNQSIKTNSKVVYVDVDAKNSGSLQIGSIENPYSHIAQALLYNNSQNSHSGVEIHLVRDGDYGFIGGTSNQYVRLMCDTPNCKVHSIFLRAGTYYISNLNVDTSVLVNEQSELYQTNINFNRQSRVYLSNVKIQGSVKQSCAINLEGAHLFVSNCVIANFTNLFRLQAGSSLIDDGLGTSNYTYRYWCTTRNCVISSSENFVKVNPDGVLPNGFGRSVKIPFTVSGNNITLKPNITDDTLVLLRFKIIVDTGHVTYLPMLVQYGGSQNGNVDNVSGNMYVFYANVNQTSFGFTYAIGIRKINNNNEGVWQSITDQCTITVDDIWIV